MPKKTKVTVYEPGTIVRFLGYAETPAEGSILEEGEEYEILSAQNVGSKEYEMSYYLKIPNMDFDADEDESDENVPYFYADVFPDEIEFVSAPETEESGSTVEEEATAEVVEEAEEEAQPKKTKDQELAEMFAKVEKGDWVAVNDISDDEYSGEVVRKTKTLLAIKIPAEDDDHTSEVLSFRLKDLTGLRPADAPAPPSTEEIEQKVENAVRRKTKAKKAETVEEAKDEVTEQPVKRGRGRPKGSKNKKTREKEVQQGKAPKSKLSRAPVQESEDEELKGMIILAADEEDQDILNLIEDADNICDLAEELTHEAANADYRLGGVLYHVRLSKAYKELDEKYSGINGFAAYVSEQLGMHYRKAMYLVNIYCKWRKYGLDADKVADLGWSKAQIVAQYLDEDNADTLLDIADTTPVMELRDAIRETISHKGTDARERVKKITIKLRFIEEQGMIVQDYLEMAMKELNLSKLEDVVEHIVTEWAQEHMDVTKLRKQAKKVEEVEEAEDLDIEEEVPRARKKVEEKKRAVGKPTVHRRVVQQASAS